MNFGDLNLNQLYIVSQMVNHGIDTVDQDLKEQAYDLIAKIRDEIDKRENARLEEDK